MGAVRGLGPGPWPAQGRIPHRTETATPLSPWNAPDATRLMPFGGFGMPRQDYGTHWSGPVNKPMAFINEDGSLTLVDTVDLNQGRQQLPPQVPIMGPTMSGYVWGGLPDGGRGAGTGGRGYGRGRRVKGR